MSIFVQILIAMGAVSVMFGIIWLIIGRLRTPILWGSQVRVSTVVSATGEAEGLEQALDGLIWLQENGLLKGQIVIADCGMDRDGERLARQAVKKYGKIAICKAEDVRQWIVETQ